MRVGGAGGRRPRPRSLSRRDRRIRRLQHEHLLSEQYLSRPSGHRGLHRYVSGRRIPGPDGRRAGVSRHARVVQAGPTGPESDHPNRLLDLARRGRASLPKPAVVPVGHGVGWRRVDLFPATSRLSASGRRHGFGGRSLPAVRRVRQRDDLRQRRGRRPPEAAGGRDRRRRPYLRRHPRLWPEQ